jgi:hypothetical protein
VLLDQAAPVEDRGEAAGDLGAWDEPEALEALLRVAVDGSQDEYVLEHAGESIADIWNRRNSCDPAVVARLAPAARDELLLILDPSLKLLCLPPGAE